MTEEWYEPKHKVENHLWILEDDQIGRTQQVDYDIDDEVDLKTPGNRGWLVHTDHGVVFMVSWRPNLANSSVYIERHIWIGKYRYWDRKRDNYSDDKKRVQSVYEFAQLVMDEIERVAAH